MANAGSCHYNIIEDVTIARIVQEEQRQSYYRRRWAAESFFFIFFAFSFLSNSTFKPLTGAFILLVEPNQLFRIIQ